jgi:hypothetical protein
MLFSESKLVRGNVVVEQGARDALQHSDRSLEFYAEYLDAARFSDETYYRLFREYLQEKYAQRPPDLVMAFLARKFELAGKLPAEILPKAPVVFAALKEEEIPVRLGSNVTGVVQRMNFEGALAVILKVRPDTDRIIVIGGMPQRTAILVATVFRDAAGETFSPEDVAGWLTACSSIPIFVFRRCHDRPWRGRRSGCAPRGAGKTFRRTRPSRTRWRRSRFVAG